MSNGNTTDDATSRMFNDATGVFSKMWSEFASKMASSGFSMPQDQSPADMAKQMRNTFFNAWAEACERYMRSDEFQQMMRESMTAAIELRKQMNEQFGELHSNFQGASRQDIDRLMHSIEQLDGRVTETYEQLVSCLESLSTRLDALETKTPARKTPTKRSAAKPKTTKKKRTTKKKTR